MAFAREGSVPYVGPAHAEGDSHRPILVSSSSSSEHLNQLWHLARLVWQR